VASSCVSPGATALHPVGDLGRVVRRISSAGPCSAQSPLGNRQREPAQSHAHFGPITRFESAALVSSRVRRRRRSGDASPLPRYGHDESCQLQFVESGAGSIPRHAESLAHILLAQECCGSAGSRTTARCAEIPRQPFREPRSHCEMTPSPAVDDRDETARQILYTVCY